MADIKINDLKPTGAELFSDSESFMDELSNDQLANIQVYGGISTLSLFNCDHHKIGNILRDLAAE